MDMKNKESIDAWMIEYQAKQDADNKVKNDLSKKIIKLLKGVDRVSCLPTILANVFEAIESPSGTDEIHGFKNQIVNWGIETYAGRKIEQVIPRLRALYNYCVDEEYTEDNMWHWGSGDRCVCYLPADGKEVLLFENQNVKFVVVFDGYKVHVREVFESLVDNDDHSFYSFKNQYFNSVTELREGLKREKGLEIAICNLTGRYTRFSNAVEGNEYPDRIDINTMRKANFDKSCHAFRYGDNRDCGYIMSAYSGMLMGEKCEINDINRADYAFYDMSGATFEIPKSYLKAIKREESLNKLGI